MKHIGVIGHGFVGGAVHYGFKAKGGDRVTVHVYDKFKPEVSNVSSVKELCEKARVIFVCLPTPMRKDGSCDTSLVEGAVAELAEHATGHVAVVKSTVPPGTTTQLNSHMKPETGQVGVVPGTIFSVVFNPEFLTEKNYLEDFVNQDRVIVGGPGRACSEVVNLYSEFFPEAKMIITGSDTAEMVKYVTNCFLSTKVSLANELAQVCSAMGVIWHDVADIASLDSRLGTSHWSAPGHDGHWGFGGSCFPKDVNAMISHAKSLGVKPTVLEGVWEKNLEVRPERDWEKLTGRAVVSSERKFFETGDSFSECVTSCPNSEDPLLSKFRGIRKSKILSILSVLDEQEIEYTYDADPEKDWVTPIELNGCKFYVEATHERLLMGGSSKVVHLCSTTGTFYAGDLLNAIDHMKESVNGNT